jgi:SAM-dependent methyltransferase
MWGSVRKLLKRSAFLITVVNYTRDFRAKWFGGRRTNYEIVEGLVAFSPNSAGTVQARGGLALQSAQQTFPLICKLLNMISKPLLEPVRLESLFPPSAGKNETDELAQLFRRHGSDKSSPHNYHLLYGPLLTQRRNELLRILEIGLGSNNTDVVSNMGRSGVPGASLRAFRDFLPNAHLYGADVDRRILFTEDRIKTYYVDQTRAASFNDLADAIGNEAFDLVIDDGLHSPNANIATLIFALRMLRPSGIFVVEDIAPKSIPIWQVVDALLPDSYDAKLIQAEYTLLFLVKKPV